LVERTALSIKFSEFEGNRFNYNTFEFEQVPDK